jgi:hypothetical protein
MVPILGALLRAGIGSVLFGRMVSTNQFPQSSSQVLRNRWSGTEPIKFN